MHKSQVWSQLFSDTNSLPRTLLPLNHPIKLKLMRGCQHSPWTLTTHIFCMICEAIMVDPLIKILIPSVMSSGSNLLHHTCMYMSLVFSLVILDSRLYTVCSFKVLLHEYHWYVWTFGWWFHMPRQLNMPEIVALKSSWHRICIPSIHDDEGNGSEAKRTFNNGLPWCCVSCTVFFNRSPSS